MIVTTLLKEKMQLMATTLGLLRGPILFLQQEEVLRMGREGDQHFVNISDVSGLLYGYFLNSLSSSSVRWPTFLF